MNFIINRTVYKSYINVTVRVRNWHFILLLVDAKVLLKATL